jgi:hypothetical protein
LPAAFSRTAHFEVADSMQFPGKPLGLESVDIGTVVVDLHPNALDELRL